MGESQQSKNAIESPAKSMIDGDEIMITGEVNNHKNLSMASHEQSFVVKN
jgi:hypothetical protein